MSNPLDLAAAFYQISPDATYRLTQSPPTHELLEWRGPGPQPTPEEIQAAWLKCTRFDETINPFPFGAGTSVRVFTAEDVQSVTLLVRGVPVSVLCVDGEGLLEIAPLQAPTLDPHILVEAQDKATFGSDSLTLIGDNMPPIVVPPTQQELDSQDARAQRAQDRANLIALAVAASNAATLVGLRAIVASAILITSRLAARITGLEEDIREIKRILIALRRNR